MTKQELLSTYTPEQLAEMVIALDIALHDKENMENIVRKYNSKKSGCCCEKVILPKEYENSIKEILNIDMSEIKDDCHRFSIEGLQRYLKMDSPKKQSEIDSLKEQLTRSQTTIAQIDGILEELFGVKHDAVQYREFEQLLREKATEKVFNFLPAEPIKVAVMLINATHTREKTLMEKTFSKAAVGNNDDTIAENMYSVSELRQIVEHLLVYCNANEEDGNAINR